MGGAPCKSAKGRVGALSSVSAFNHKRAPMSCFTTRYLCVCGNAIECHFRMQTLHCISMNLMLASNRFLYVVVCNVTAFSDPPSGTAIQAVSPVVIGQSVDLVCTASGDPLISFTWVLMGAETNRLNSDPTSGNLTLTITQVNQYGVYICITTNNLGTDAASIDITQASKYINE